MIIQIQSSASWSETLKARKEHLTDLLKIVDIKTGKITPVQTLTVTLMKEEISYIESKLKGRP
jgi:hypothetical protein